jgi:hypothetical protein
VALKTMLADALARPELAERFDREARAAARLEHPHIVPIYEVGRHQGRPYYTMALAEGSLAQHAGRFMGDARAAVTLMEKVARAVHHAHERGILHRDLKPGNILLDARGEPLVSDFGLAKILDDEIELTRSGEVIGTPAYMAPEQAGGGTQPVTAAADIWALGVFLYELLTGRRPFLGPGREQLLHQIRTATPPRPSALEPKVDPALEAVVLKCLAKDPARRYPSAGVLADDLWRWLQGERWPEPRRRRWRRILRRHPWRSAAAAVGLAAALALALALLLPALTGGGPTDGSVPPAEPPLMLIGESGPPGESEWLFGEKGAVTGVAPQDGAFTVRTPRACALRLGQPPWGSYRLEAQVRHDEGGDGSVGLCFDYRRLPPGPGGWYCFCNLVFADRGRPAGSTGMNMMRRREGSAAPSGHAPLLPPHSHKPPGSDGPAPWRGLAVEVTPAEVRFYWKGDADEVCLGRVSRADLRESGAVLFRGLSDVAWEEGPAGSCGLTVTAGAGSFRQVVVKPLP